jgi:hypothetical protein
VRRETEREPADRQIVLRAPASIVERAERIHAGFARQHIRLSLSEVYRLALERGLGVLERRARR